LDVLYDLAVFLDIVARLGFGDGGEEGI